jgi:hypothetical protein
MAKPKDELAQVKAETAALEKQVIAKASKNGSEFNKAFNDARKGGKSVADAYNQADLAVKANTNKSSTGDGGGSSETVKKRAMWDPHLGKVFGKMGEAVLGGSNEAIDTLSGAASSIQKVTRQAATHSKRYKRLAEQTAENIAGTTAGITGGIDSFSDSITRSLDTFSEQIRTNTKPISDFMGQTLGTLTGVIEDPLGPNGLGNAATRLINSVSPGMGDKINGLNKSLHLEALGRLPGQAMASIGHIMQAVNDLLAIPLSILSEIYYGLQAIMKSISKMINSVIDGFMSLLMNFLDSIIPIKSIMGLLNSISDLAGQIGGLAGAFNLSMVTDITSQITGFTDQFTDILNNPLDFATSFLPADVTNILDGLNDPEKLLGQFLPTEVSSFVDGIKNPTDMIKQFLPPQLAQGFDKISSMTGLGYTGNMGYGFGSSLKENQGNVLNNLMANFQQQLPILAPLLAGQAETPEAQQPKLLGEGDTVASHHLYQNRDKQPQYQKAQKA